MDARLGIRACAYLLGLLALWPLQSAAYTEPLRELHADGRLVLRESDRAFISASLPPSFSLSLDYQTDSTVGSLHFNLQGLPKPDLLNLYVLPADDLVRIGVSLTSACVAEMQDGYRYIFCDLGRLRYLSARMADVLNDAVPETFLARLVLSHEVAHHFYNHPTLDPNHSAGTAQIRVYEREADTEAAIMLAEPFFREQFVQSMFADASPADANDGLFANIWAILNERRATHDDLTQRFRSIAARVVQVYAGHDDHLNMIPNIPPLDLRSPSTLRPRPIQLRREQRQPEHAAEVVPADLLGRGRLGDAGALLISSILVRRARGR